jgi:hypothetical protein
MRGRKTSSCPSVRSTRQSIFTGEPSRGTAWHPKDHQQGGQPKARVENGSARLSVAGPWQNHEFQKIVGLWARSETQRTAESLREKLQG